MATRIESRGIQIAAPGGAPMERVVPQQVDYMVAAREEARGAGAMADILDRMSQSISVMAKDLAQEEALKFAASNPITDDQLQLAKDGMPSAIRGVGKLGSSSTVYGKALQKARMFQLSGHFEMEGRNELTRLLVDVQNGKIKSEDVATKIDNVTNGYAKSLAQIDGEAAIKFRATMATHGNTVLNAAYESEQKRKKATDITKFDLDFDNSMQLLEATVSQGFWVDNNGKQRSIDDLAGIIQTNIANQSLLIGDAQIQKEYSEKFRVGLRTAKINAVTKHLTTDEFMADPLATLQKIKSGDVGKMGAVLKQMNVNDFDAVAKVTANFMVAVTERETIASRAREAAKLKGQGDAIDLLEQIFPLKPNNPKRKELITKLLALPPGSTPIGTLDSLLSPEKPTGTDDGNSLTYYNTLDLIYDEKIKTKEDLDKIPGLSTKQRIALLKIINKDDKSNDSKIDRAVNKLAQLPETSNGGFVLDPKSEEFKKRQKLKVRAAEIENDAVQKGQPITTQEIIQQLEKEELDKKNKSDAKQARDALDYFVTDKSGRAKPDRDWITGPINRQTLPALRQKAEATKDPGDRTKRIRQIQEIERLLKASEGT
jgi:hypothetical protein